MESIADLYVKLGADVTNFMGGMRTAERGAKDAELSLGGLAAASAAVVGGVALAGAAVGVISLKMAADFDSAMLLIQTQAHATMTGANSLDHLKQSVLDLAGPTAQSPLELAKALYHIESVGITGAAALDALRAAAMGAAVGQTDVEGTSQALTATLRNYPQYLGHATDAMAVLNAIVGAGNMRMGDLNAAMSTGLDAAAATFGVSLTSVGSALAVLTDKGMPADEAATRLRMTLALMAAPSAKATKELTALGLTAKDIEGFRTNASALQHYGIKLTSLADDLRKPNGLLVALQDLKTHMDAAHLSPEQQGAAVSQAFGGGRSGSAVEALFQSLGQQGGLADKYAQVIGGAAKFQGDFADTTHTLNFQLASLKGNLEAAAIKLGERLMPYALAFVTWLNGLGPAFATAGGMLQQFAGWIENNVVPAIKKMWTWLQENLIPAFGRLWNFLTANVFPALSSFGRVLLQIGDFLITYVIPPILTLIGKLMEITGAILPPLIQGFGAVNNLLAIVLVPTLTVLGRAFDEAMLGVESTVDGIRRAIEWLIGKVQDLIGALAQVHMPSVSDVVHVGGFLNPLNHIPGFATGVVANSAGGQLVTIGESGPEAVLNQMQMGQMIQYARGSGGGGGIGTVNINIDGTRGSRELALEIRGALIDLARSGGMGNVFSTAGRGTLA